jgi:hypothetical protein
MICGDRRFGDMKRLVDSARIRIDHHGLAVSRCLEDGRDASRVMAMLTTLNDQLATCVRVPSDASIRRNGQSVSLSANLAGSSERRHTTR